MIYSRRVDVRALISLYPRSELQAESQDELMEKHPSTNATDKIPNKGMATPDGMNAYCKKTLLRVPTNYQLGSWRKVVRVSFRLQTAGLFDHYICSLKIELHEIAPFCSPL